MMCAERSAKDIDAATCVFIGLGSNVNPERNLVAALDRLCDALEVRAVSTVYRTKPLERPEQDDFLNAVVAAATSLPPRALKFDVLRRIESELGRVRSDDAHAPRTIDLDLVLYGNRIMDEADLQLPDPDIWERPFIAEPLRELAPSLVMPDTRERIASIAAALDCTGLTPEPALTHRLRDRLRP